MEREWEVPKEWRDKIFLDGECRYNPEMLTKQKGNYKQINDLQNITR